MSERESVRSFTKVGETETNLYGKDIGNVSFDWVLSYTLLISDSGFVQFVLMLFHNGDL